MENNMTGFGFFCVVFVFIAVFKPEEIGEIAGKIHKGYLKVMNGYMEGTK